MKNQAHLEFAAFHRSNLRHSLSFDWVAREIIEILAMHIHFNKRNPLTLEFDWNDVPEKKIIKWVLVAKDNCLKKRIQINMGWGYGKAKLGTTPPVAVPLS